MRLRVLRSLLRLGIDNLHARAQNTGMESTTATTKGTEMTKREQAIAEVVAQGFSREFAESFIPMTVAEAKRRNLPTSQFVSEITLINPRRTAR